MAKYTDKQFFMDNYLVQTLDLICERLNSHLDAILVADGDEGTGKSNLAVGVCYYVAWKTGRKFDIDNVFFDLDKFIDFAKSTEKQVICFDEAALGGLSDQWQSKIQQRLIQLVMVCRKKGHFVIMNIPKFFKLREYLILDRAIGLLHTYSPDQKSNGNYCYYNKEAKEKLFYDWKKTRKRNYKHYYSFRGSFVKMLHLVLDEEAYEKKKDEAILSIGKEKEEYTSRYKIELEKWKIKMTGLVDAFGITNKDLAKYFGINIDTLYEWRKLSERRAFNNNRQMDENFEDNRLNEQVIGTPNNSNKLIGTPNNYDEEEEE